MYFRLLLCSSCNALSTLCPLSFRSILPKSSSSHRPRKRCSVLSSFETEHSLRVTKTLRKSRVRKCEGTIARAQSTRRENSSERDSAKCSLARIVSKRKEGRLASRHIFMKMCFIHEPTSGCFFTPTWDERASSGLIRAF